MTKEKFAQIVSEHNVTIVTGYDIENAIYFVADILRAEAEHLRESEPHATRSIERYESAAFVIEHEIYRDELVDMFEQNEAERHARQLVPMPGAEKLADLKAKYSE